MSKHALVIGSSGGIGKEIIKQLCESDKGLTVHTVSRSFHKPQYPNQKVYQFDSTDEAAVIDFITQKAANNVKFSQVICTTGILHTSGEMTLKPEKRLEDIDIQSLTEYFRVNTIVPAIWLKHLVSHLSSERASVVFFSARVGSISENGLGGWYGYRASKAALNMIVKTASIEYKRRSPNVTLACYHPGTVNTELSKPFQANVKPGKLFTAEFTVSQLRAFMHDFNSELSPYYIDWEGKTIQY